jgi:hypothetical protein
MEEWMAKLMGMMQGAPEMEQPAPYGVELGTGPAWDQNFPPEQTYMGDVGLPPEESEANELARGAFARQNFNRYGHGPDAGTSNSRDDYQSVYRNASIADLQTRLGKNRREQEWQRMMGSGRQPGALESYTRGLLE